jgi:hypothetical protein
MSATGLTLAEYVKAKRLPEDFLRRLGITDSLLAGIKVVRIPYMNQNGREAAVRFRLSLDGESRFKWKTGLKPILYGLGRLEAIKKTPCVWLDEGESDTQTLWAHNIAALGLPGANSWREEWAKYFEGFERIYVVIEPDSGGEAVLKWLRGSSIRNRVRLVRLDGAKDVSELYLKDPKNFKAALKRAVAEAQTWEEFQQAERQAQVAVLWEECKDLASRDDILGEFEQALVQRGVVGEAGKAKLIYLALTSRLLDRIVSIGPKGVSSAGKSFVTDSVLDFFPPSAYYRLTAMSEKALAYGDEPLAHRFLILNEAVALSGQFAPYFVRSLLSEGKLIYETVEKGPDGKLASRRIEREGPTGLIVTTTRIALHPENETRFISMQLDDSPEQTARILRSEAAHAAGHSSRSPEEDEEFLSRWRALQELLVATDNRVVIPYASAIAALVPPVAVRLRRDFKSILSLVAAHAILHQMTRERDQQGRIIAKFADYRVVRELAHEWIAEGAERTVSEKIRQTVGAVAEICAEQPVGVETATVAEVAARLRLDRSAAYRRIRQCIDRGFLRNEEKIDKGRAMKVAIGDPMPEDQSLLPTVEQVFAHIKKQRPR